MGKNRKDRKGRSTDVDPAPFVQHDVTEELKYETGLAQKALIVIITVVIFIIVRQIYLT